MKYLEAADRADVFVAHGFPEQTSTSARSG